MDALEKQGRTPMHLAALRASPEFIQVLVNHGATPDAPTRNPRFSKEIPEEIADGAGKAANVALLKSLNVTLNSVQFAAKMKKGAKK